MAVFVLISLLLVLVFLAFPNDNHRLLRLNNQVLTAFEHPLVTSAKIDNLKGELVGLVSGTIENKLISLEEGIRLGSVLSSLQTVQNIRNDVKVLHKYSDPLEQKQQQVVLKNAHLIEEVSHLKDLIYLTLGICSLMFSAFLFIWSKNRKRSAYLDFY
jgi:hypothetical protein